MNDLLRVTLIGLFSGITGTGIGGATAFFIKGISKRMLSVILEFSAGLMTAVVCFELVPESFKSGGILYTLAGIFIGILTILVIENYIRKIEFTRGRKGNNSLLHAGILMSIGIALHNFPEGFAVGSGFEASLSLGFTITLVILIHDIPEGIAMAVPMKAGGFSAMKAFLLTVLSGVPMGLGALLGALLGGMSSRLIGGCLGLASGAMLYVIYGELLPESKRMYFGRLSSLGNILGIICGIVVSLYN